MGFLGAVSWEMGGFALSVVRGCVVICIGLLVRDEGQSVIKQIRYLIRKVYYFAEPA